MRTNIVINQNLINSAMKLSGLKTKREAVEEGLKLLVQTQKQRKKQMRAQRELAKLRGKLRWEGDLEAMRLD